METPAGKEHWTSYTEFFSLTDIEKVFGVKPDAPDPQFTEDTMQEARHHKPQLLFYSDKMFLNERKNGEKLSTGNVVPVTLENLKKQFPDAFQGMRELNHPNFPSWKTITPRPKWVLVYSDGLRGSDKKNFLEQTDEVAAYIRSIMGKGIIPKNSEKTYQRALDEYELKRAEISALMQGKNGEYTAFGPLIDLLINRITMESAVEAAYRHILCRARSKSALINSGKNVRFWGPSSEKGGPSGSLDGSLKTLHFNYPSGNAGPGYVRQFSLG